jgi:outer membrane protein assembly factor BamB
VVILCSILLVILCAKSTAIYANTSSSEDDWPMFSHDAARTGYSTGAGPTTSIGSVLSISLSVDSGPVVSGDRVYVGANGADVCCINGSTGVTIWKFTTGDTASCPAIFNGHVYTGVESGTVFCIDALTGTEIWNYTLKGVIKFSSPAVADNFVCLGSWDGELYTSASYFGNIYCLDSSTGAKLWNYSTKAPIIQAPAIKNGYVYVGSGLVAYGDAAGDGKLYALNASTGTEIWNYTPEYAATFAPFHVRAVSSPAVAGGYVYICPWSDMGTYCLNASTGDQIWRETLSGPDGNSPAVANGCVYVPSYTGRIFALDAFTGTAKWNTSVIINFYRMASVSTPAVASDYLYVGSWGEIGTTQGTVNCIDASTGATIWNYTIGEGLSSPAVANECVYISSSHDGKLYAFAECAVLEEFPSWIILPVASISALTSELLIYFKKRKH